MQFIGTDVQHGTVFLVESADVKGELSATDVFVVQFIHRGQY